MNDEDVLYRHGTPPSLMLSKPLGFMFDIRNDKLKLMSNGMWHNLYHISRASDHSFFSGEGKEDCKLSIDSDDCEEPRRISTTRRGLLRKCTPSRRSCLTGKSPIRVNYTNRLPSIKRPVGKEDYMKPTRKVDHSKLIRQGHDRKPLSEVDNHTKEKVGVEQIPVSVHRRLKLDIGDLEAKIRLEKQKRDGGFRATGKDAEQGKEVQFNPRKLEELMFEEIKKKREFRKICNEVDIFKAKLKIENDERMVAQIQQTLSALNSNWEWEGILKKQYGFKENELNGILYNPKPYMVKTVGRKKIEPGDARNHVYKCHYTSMEAAVSILKGGNFNASQDGTWGAGLYICQHLPNGSNARDMLCMNSFGNVFNEKYQMSEWKYRRDSGCCDVGIMLCVPEKIVLVHTEMSSQDERIVEKIGNSPQDNVTFSLESKDFVREGEVIEIRNTRHFRDVLKKNKLTLIVIKFGASWCGPSHAMTEVFKRLAKKYRNCVFLYVDADEVNQVKEDYSVHCFPTFVFLKKKSIELKEFRIKGAHTEKLLKTIEKLATEYSARPFPGKGYSLTGGTQEKRQCSKTCPKYRTHWANKDFGEKKPTAKVTQKSVSTQLPIVEKKLEAKGMQKSVSTKLPDQSKLANERKERQGL